MKTKELFQALEFAHYAERFRDKVFVVAFPPEVPFQELSLDIKVLAGYHIKIVLVVPDPDFHLEGLVATSNKRGTRFHLSLVTDALYHPSDTRVPIDLVRTRRVLAEGRPVIIAYHAEFDPQHQLPPTYPLAGEVAQRLGADKLFLLGQATAQWKAVLARTHVTADELPQVCALLHQAQLEQAQLHQAQLEGSAGNTAASSAATDSRAVLDYVAHCLRQGLPDVVALEGETGHLFREVFTHDGAGILFNSVRRAQVRPARLGDITDVSLLLRPEMEAGRILPVDENVIEQDIGDFWIYEVDHLLVGVARLKRYGTWAELAHFSTLPRYRGKGRARELALSMIRQAEDQAAEAVFALSVDPRMEAFFHSLGFRPSPREMLPEAWQRQYDFTRPSHAFIKELG